MGDLKRAAVHHGKAASLPTQPIHYTNYANLGIVYHELGRLTEARDQLTLALFIGPDDPRNHVTMGCIYHDMSWLSDAQEHATAGLTLHRELGNKSGQVGALGLLAEVHADAGRLECAVEYAATSRTIADEIDDDVSKALSHMGTGHVLVQGGRYQEARDHSRLALRLAQEIGYRVVEVHALLRLAQACRGLCDLKPAEQAARLCLDLARKTGYRVLEGRALSCLAEIRSDQGHPGEANRYACEALNNHRETGHRFGEARTLATLARIADATCESEAASRHRRDALACFDEIGAPIPTDLRAIGATASEPAGSD